MMRLLLKFMSFTGLALTLIPSFLVYLDIITIEHHKIIALVGTILWLCSAPFWLNRETRT